MYTTGDDESAVEMADLSVEKFFQGFTEKRFLNKNHVSRICTMYVISYRHMFDVTSTLIAGDI